MRRPRPGYTCSGRHRHRWVYIAGNQITWIPDVPGLTLLHPHRLFTSCIDILGIQRRGDLAFASVFTWWTIPA
jgi:hypothetical protein